MSAAPSIVQHVKGAATGSTVTLTGTLGNLYVLLAWAFGALSINATDTAGNTWTRLFDQADGSGNHVGVYVAPIVNGGSTTVNDVTGSGGFIDVVEVSGWSGNANDWSSFSMAVPSTNTPFTVPAAQQKVLRPSLFIMLSEDQSTLTLSSGLDGNAATILDTFTGLDSSYCWQITQTSVPALVNPNVGATGGTTDNMSFGGIVIPNGDAPAADTFGGGYADDRYRFRQSRFCSHTSTLGQHRVAWPDDAMDFGMQDIYTDFGSRMN